MKKRNEDRKNAPTTYKLPKLKSEALKDGFLVTDSGVELANPVPIIVKAANDFKDLFKDLRW